MIEFNRNEHYVDEIACITALFAPSELSDKTVMISGATGMIGTFLVDLLMHWHNIHVIALGRNRDKAIARFNTYWDTPNFSFIECDVTSPIPSTLKVDYVIHAASPTHPVAYATEPIGTITSNVLGTKNLLDYGINHGMKRFVFISSVEVYGENRGDV